MSKKNDYNKDYSLGKEIEATTLGSDYGEVSSVYHKERSFIPSPYPNNKIIAYKSPFTSILIKRREEKFPELSQTNKENLEERKEGSARNISSLSEIILNTKKTGSYSSKDLEFQLRNTLLENNKHKEKTRKRDDDKNEESRRNKSMNHLLGKSLDHDNSIELESFVKAISNGSLEIIGEENNDLEDAFNDISKHEYFLKNNPKSVNKDSMEFNSIVKAISKGSLKISKEVSFSHKNKQKNREKAHLSLNKRQQKPKIIIVKKSSIISLLRFAKNVEHLDDGFFIARKDEDKFIIDRFDPGSIVYTTTNGHDENHRCPTYLLEEDIPFTIKFNKMDSINENNYFPEFYIKLQDHQMELTCIWKEMDVTVDFYKVNKEITSKIGCSKYEDSLIDENEDHGFVINENENIILINKNETKEYKINGIWYDKQVKLEDLYYNIIGFLKEFYPKVKDGEFYIIIKENDEWQVFKAVFLVRSFKILSYKDEYQVLIDSIQNDVIFTPRTIADKSEEGTKDYSKMSSKELVNIIEEQQSIIKRLQNELKELRVDANNDTTKVKSPTTAVLSLNNKSLC
ncbi:hypothetical protein K502DRAFT_341480 [Neoconidiobolus thromboides FSU 785]|nr:hypothetical protein K502DRAFT_341480 [Neoconidiobolus thromboides FSU 785]